MAHPPKILALAGSLRAESFNRQLLQIAAVAAREAGAEVTHVDLRDYRLPIFDEDLEARDGLPPAAQQLKQLFLAHQGLLLASPEYNSSVTAVLKNTLDWVSRPVAGQPRLAPFLGKTAALLSASPWALGGLRGLVHLRAILSNIQVLVLPDQVAVPEAHTAFDAAGRLRDSGRQQVVADLGRKLVDVVRKLHQG